jgi:Zn-dependent M28 family amino/carboxypeptidase
VGFVVFLVLIGWAIYGFLPKPLFPEPDVNQFLGQAAYEHVLRQVELGPRPTGSEAGRKTGDYIIAQLQAAGWAVEEQPFVYQGVAARNIIAKAGQGPVAILGAHYDTRLRADKDPDLELQADPVLGANDGASGVAVLLELARALDKDELDYEVWLTFFDAEDNGRLDGGDYIAGSRFMAANLAVRPEMVIVADMIGDADQQIYKERNSSPELLDRIWGIAADLGYDDYFIPEYKWPILDDHMPFLEMGIPAADLIDFDYPYWHTTQDTADKISADSLERVGRVLEFLVEGP